MRHTKTDKSKRCQYKIVSTGANKVVVVVDLLLCAMKDLISEFLHQRVPVNLSAKDRLPEEDKIITYTESKAGW